MCQHIANARCFPGFTAECNLQLPGPVPDLFYQLPTPAVRTRQPQEIEMALGSPSV